MGNVFRTASIAIVSSLSTALLFVACTVDTSGGQGAAGPTSTVPAPSAQTSQSPQAQATAPGQSAVRSAPALPQPQVASARAQTPAQAAVGVNPAAQVYRDNGASVVNITSIAVVRTRQGQSTQPQGIGSGSIIDTEGRIITNNHVIQDAQQLQVTFQDRTTVPAKLVGRDVPNDLAVIQVDPNANDDTGRPIRDRLKPVRMGDSDKVVIGEDAIAIGSPLGLQQTVTSGIISALRNPGEESAQGSIDLLGGAIQTDASINPGNSGGPLFNSAGEVVGINTAILSQSGGNEGIGFAIPINVAKRMIPELIQTGSYRHPLVGITSIALSSLGQATRQQLGVPENQRGLLVLDTSAGAQQAGVRGGSRTVNAGGESIPAGGDIIVAIDGKPMTTSGDLRGYVENNKRPGDAVTLTVLRGGQRLDIQVTLTERPPETGTPTSTTGR
ncbi:MAG: trypsin-like peptidase domain-containing protein [Chloroflexi bacterium]|nr:trypsin-like peptidase domain-containing protein [Chloroflexota bacterium]